MAAIAPTVVSRARKEGPIFATVACFDLTPKTRALAVNTYFSAVSGRAPNHQTFLTVTVDITARWAAEDALRAAQSELARVVFSTTFRRSRPKHGVLIFGVFAPQLGIVLLKDLIRSSSSLRNFFGIGHPSLFALTTDAILIAVTQDVRVCVFRSCVSPRCSDRP
jgi:hypothetical protein